MPVLVCLRFRLGSGSLYSKTSRWVSLQVQYVGRLRSDLFARQELEEALRHSVVMAIASAAHRVFQIVFAQKYCPFTAGK